MNLKDPEIEKVLKDIEATASQLAVAMRKENPHASINMASIRHRVTVGVLVGYIKGEYKPVTSEVKEDGKQTRTSSKKRSASSSAKL